VLVLVLRRRGASLLLLLLRRRRGVPDVGARAQEVAVERRSQEGRGGRRQVVVRPSALDPARAVRAWAVDRWVE
jgi:hypothetical protein